MERERPEHGHRHRHATVDHVERDDRERGRRPGEDEREVAIASGLASSCSGAAGAHRGNGGHAEEHHLGLPAEIVSGAAGAGAGDCGVRVIGVGDRARPEVQRNHHDWERQRCAGAA